MTIREQLAHCTHNELIRMHEFYCFGPKENKQCQNMLAAIEHELTDRVCKELDLIIDGCEPVTHIL